MGEFVVVVEYWPADYAATETFADELRAETQRLGCPLLMFMDGPGAAPTPANIMAAALHLLAPPPPPPPPRRRRRSVCQAVRRLLSRVCSALYRWVFQPRAKKYSLDLL